MELSQLTSHGIDLLRWSSMNSLPEFVWRVNRRDPGEWRHYRCRWTGGGTHLPLTTSGVGPDSRNTIIERRLWGRQPVGLQTHTG